MVHEALYYRISWRNRSSRPGQHKSSQQGAGMVFSHHGGLFDSPDLRRFDLIASIRDPYQRLRFRIYQQTTAVPIIAVVDFSASMGFANKMAVVADFVASLAHSALRSADPFSFIACAESLRSDWWQPPSHNLGAAQALVQRLRVFVPDGLNMAGLAQLAALITGRRSLLFLISDFHFPDHILRQALPALSYHDVVPVVVWQTQEYADLPAFGLARLRDPENGHERTYWLRPSLRQQIERNFAQREQVLIDLFADFALQPLFIKGPFCADDVTRYFYA